MSDPTAAELQTAMAVLGQHTGENQICLESECLIGIVREGSIVPDADVEVLAALGWVAVMRDGRVDYFRRPFTDH